MKKFITFILSLAVLFSCVSMPVSAAIDNFGFGDNMKSAMFYLLNEGLPVPEGTSSQPAQNYTYVGKGLINTSSPLTDMNGVDSVIVKAPEVKLKEGQSVLWYVVKHENSDGWHVDGVITPFWSFVYNAGAEDVTGETTDPMHYRKDSTVSVAVNSYSRPGYTFAGWNTAADGSGTAYAEGDKIVIESLGRNENMNVVTLYAQWTKNAEIIAPVAPVNPDISTGDTVKLGIVTPKKMSVRFEDGTVYYGGESIEIEVGKTYRFQMCSNNWDNDTYDDYGNGICGTVVYSMRVSDRYDELSYDPENHSFVIPLGDPVLRTDVNKCFMAYRYHFTSGDYNKQTGIKQVVNTPLESLSVNLPLGSTISSDAYKAMEWIDTENVFIENNNGEGIYESVYLTSVNDYYWDH